MGEKNMQLAKLVSACKEYPSPGLVRRKRSPYSITAAAIATVIALAGVAGSSHAAIITVSSLNDDTANGYCDLREAINSANGGAGIGNCTAGTGQDTIVFNITGTITIGSRLPDITKSLAIIGPGTAPGITLDGADKYEVMIVDSDATLNLSQLTIADGNAGVGGILNLGTLTVNDSTFDGNIGNSGGGAIASFGTLTVTNSTFANNGGFDGGGIDNGGTATVTNSSFNGNAASGQVPASLVRPISKGHFSQLQQARTAPAAWLWMKATTSTTMARAASAPASLRMRRSSLTPTACRAMAARPGPSRLSRAVRPLIRFQLATVLACRIRPPC
jgi:hypothetical protein